MKSKFYLGALAVSMMFAACSEEELVTNVSDNTLDERPVVGEIVLGVPTDVQTRWTYDGAPSFEAGVDVIGACLMDTWAWGDINPDPEVTEMGDKYTLSDNVFTNYKFGLTESGEWKSDALFSEGNYFFYMQYNDQMRSRAGLMDTIPAIQYIGASGNEAYFDNQLFLGYRFISRNDKENIGVDMHQVYAFPKFSIKYDGTDGVKIEKVVFSNNNFKLERQLNAASTIDVGEYVPFEGATAEYTVANNSTVSAYLDGYANAKTAAAAAGKKLNAPKAQIAAAMGSNAAAKNITMMPAEAASTVAGSIVVPATTYEEITVTIYTNKGIVNATVPAKSTVDAVTKRHKVAYVEVPVNAADYIEVDASLLPAALACGEGGSTKQVNISFRDGAIEVGNNLTVSTIEELENYLTNWYAGKRTETLTDLTVTLAADITLTKTVADFLANTANNPTVIFVGSDVKLTVPATLDATVLNNLNTMLEIVLEGDQNLNTLASKTFGKISNAGELTVGITNGTVPAHVITTLENKGTVKFVNDANVTIKALNNIGTVEVKKNVTVTTLNNGTAENKVGTLNIEGATITGDVINYGSIVSKGTSSITKALTNYGKVEANDNLHLATAELKAGATMDVKGIVGVSSSMSNAGTITNSGRLMNNGGSITNAKGGVIDHKAGMYTYVAVNEGTIIINEPNPAQLNIGGNDGIVEYTAVDSDFGTGKDDKDQLKSLYSEITKLIIKKTGDVKLTNLNAAVRVLSFENSGNANITFKESQELDSLALTTGAQTINAVTTASLMINGGNKVITGVVSVSKFFWVASGVNVDIYANFNYEGGGNPVESKVENGQMVYTDGDLFANYGNIFMNGGAILDASSYKKSDVWGDASRIYGTVDWK